MDDLGKHTVPVRAALAGSQLKGEVNLAGSGMDLFWPAGKASLVDGASGSSPRTGTGMRR